MTGPASAGARGTGTFGERTQDEMRARVENERVRLRWARRGRRRALVAAEAAVAVAGALVLAAVQLSYGGLALLIAFLALMALGAFLGTQVNLASRWVAGYRGLDERQRADHERALRIGHHVTAAVLFVALVVLLAVGQVAVAVPAAVLAPTVFLLAMLHFCYPAAHLAWNLPDEVPDEDDEAAAPTAGPRP
ncbi:hypothetical protein ACFO4E_24810 [Nocardiopsis mangrovi]|uniref:DUF2178 domain-containing protein n=1 Tax=Nocardiopsis mangrovi TaxID=1179818 RepID=A0ABV9E1P5_9ACTN